MSLLIARLRDVYYHQSDSSRFIGFLKDELGYALPSVASDRAFSLGAVFDAGDFEYSSWMAIFATVVYLAVLVAFPFVALLSAARSVRDAALEATHVLGGGVSVAVQEALKTGLSRTVLWHVHFVRSNVVSIAVALGLARLISGGSFGRRPRPATAAIGCWAYDRRREDVPVRRADVEPAPAHVPSNEPTYRTPSLKYDSSPSSSSPRRTKTTPASSATTELRLSRFECPSSTTPRISSGRT